MSCWNTVKQRLRSTGTEWVFGANPFYLFGNGNTSDTAPALTPQQVLNLDPAQFETRADPQRSPP